MNAADDTPDFFVSYTEADSGWAEWIAWQLEEVAGYKVVFQKWDFKAGSNFVLEMNRAASTAKKTLLVLSPAFLESGMAASEWAAGFAKDPQGLDRNVIPVLIEPTRLDGLLSQIVYVKLVGLSREDAAAALIAAIEPGRSKPLAEPAFPGSSGPTVSTATAPATKGLDWAPATSTLTPVARESVLPRQHGDDVYVALEVSLVPVETQSLRLGQMQVTADELVVTGRTSGLFTQAGAVDNGHSADAAYARVRGEDAAGILISRQGQRTAWITLPHDMLGGVLDPSRIKARVSRVLQLLMSFDLPAAERYGVAARIHPSRSLMVGDSSTVGSRSSASMGMGFEDRFPTSMPDTVWGEAIAAYSDELAEELIARVVAALQS